MLEICVRKCGKNCEKREQILVTTLFSAESFFRTVETRDSISIYLEMVHRGHRLNKQITSFQIITG